jgi:hypothetical protein
MRAHVLLLAVVVVVGVVAPAGATVATDATATDTNGPPAGAAPPADTAGVTATDANNSSVNVSAGRQLSTVLATAESEVDTGVEETALEVAFETGNESEKAEALADRAAEIREQARDIEESYREATREYEAGEMSRTEYAHRIALLNARASDLLASHEQLQRMARNVSGFELAAAGMNRTALRAAVDDVDNVTGAGASALLRRFLGETEGEVEIERADGLRISVESEDGERSREVERSRDDDDSMTVDQSTALEAARGALSEEDGNWTLSRASVHADSGYYRFRFSLATANATGETEVRVDGSSGAVFRVEEEIEPRDDDEDESEGEGDDDEAEEGVDEVAMLVAEGEPGPNETVTLRVLADGEPLPNATVLMDGEPVGQTGPNGTLAVTLPAGSSELLVEYGGEDAELEFEFEAADDERERRQVFRRIQMNASLDGNSVSLTATYNGSALGNVTVYANGERAGRTTADGTLSFTTGATEELELELVKGELEAELSYRIDDGSLVLTESTHEGDGDKAEREDDDDDEDTPEPTETEDDDEDTPEPTETEDDEDTPEPTETEDDDEDTPEPTETEDDDEDTPEPTETEDDDEDTPEPTETDDGVDSLSLSVVSGDPAPGATITVKVTSDGAPVAGATVSVESEVVGQTGDDGTIQVTLPEDEDDPRVRAETDDASGRIEFEFEE